MLVILPVTFPLPIPTTSEVYSGSLEADMSENHPTYSSVKWKNPSFLLSKSFLDAICRAQPSAGCTCLWERLVWKQITSCTFTSMYWGEFMNHPGIWFLSQQHLSVPRHVTLWLKMLVILAVTFPLTLLTTSEEYSGSQEADIPEKVFPSPDETDLSRHIHSSLEEEHILQHWLRWILYVEGRPAVGQIVMFSCVPFCRAVWWAIQLWWFSLHGFKDSCAEIGETNPKLCSE